MSNTSNFNTNIMSGFSIRPYIYIYIYIYILSKDNTVQIILLLNLDIQILNKQNKVLKIIYLNFVQKKSNSNFEYTSTSYCSRFWLEYIETHYTSFPIGPIIFNR